MIGVTGWNFQRLVDLKLPDVKLPLVFDPTLLSELNKLSAEVTGQFKYPTMHVSNTDTGERVGLQYLEPSCRPVPLDWNKHRSQKIPEPHHSEQTPPCVTATDLPEEVKTEVSAQGDVDGACALSRQMTVQPCPKKVRCPSGTSTAFCTLSTC
ncbi:hypothetical protein CRENBAI_009650 [Crenichthys baileyi]|uniref:Uncharacterized protein n=1 Tax=Crenichthys baileyi TaxID=28760 RepID=A0AAV9RUB1_9TELE